MKVRLTLRSANGSIVAERPVTPRPAAAAGGDIGQAAWAMYGEAYRAGYGPVGTTLTITNEPADDLLARAEAAVRRCTISKANGTFLVQQNRRPSDEREPGTGALQRFWTHSGALPKQHTLSRENSSTNLQLLTNEKKVACIQLLNVPSTRVVKMSHVGQSDAVGPIPGFHRSVLAYVSLETGSNLPARSQAHRGLF